jgi:FkbM family methyltransferase
MPLFFTCIFALIVSGTAVASLSLEEKQFIEQFPKDHYKIVDVPSQGSFYIDTKDDTIKQKLSLGQPWSPEKDIIIRRYTIPGSTVVDIGAHIGTHTVAMSRSVGVQGQVYAFEPQMKIFRELAKNIELNRCCNVTPIHAALGNSQGVAFLGPIEPHNEGGRSIQAKGTEPVMMQTLDSYCLMNVSFIKIDAENFEDFILDGARETILTNKPVILLEIQGNQLLSGSQKKDRKEKVKETLARLRKLGYKVKPLRDANYLAFPKTIL